MSASHSCPKCATPLQIPPQLVGRLVRCPRCQATFTAAAADAAVVEAEVAEPDSPVHPAPAAPSPPRSLYCPNCAAVLVVSDPLDARPLRCPQCQAVFAVGGTAASARPLLPLPPTSAARTAELPPEEGGWRSPEAARREWRQLRRVHDGLALHQICTVAFFGFVLLAVILEIAANKRIDNVWIGLVTLLVGLAYIIGLFMCCAAPPGSGARAWAWVTVIAFITSLVAAVAAGMEEGEQRRDRAAGRRAGPANARADRDDPFTSSGPGWAFQGLLFAGSMSYTLSLRCLAKHVRDSALARHTVYYLLLMIFLFGSHVTVHVLAKTFEHNPAFLVGLAKAYLSLVGVGGLVSIGWYLWLLQCARWAIQDGQRLLKPTG